MKKESLKIYDPYGYGFFIAGRREDYNYGTEEEIDSIRFSLVVHTWGEEYYAEMCTIEEFERLMRYEYVLGFSPFIYRQRLLKEVGNAKMIHISDYFSLVHKLWSINSGIK